MSPKCWLTVMLVHISEHTSRYFVRCTSVHVMFHHHRFFHNCAPVSIQSSSEIFGYESIFLYRWQSKLTWLSSNDLFSISKPFTAVFTFGSWTLQWNHNFGYHLLISKQKYIIYTLVHPSVYFTTFSELFGCASVFLCRQWSKAEYSLLITGQHIQRKTIGDTFIHCWL